jgi:hypothetical protein
LDGLEGINLAEQKDNCRAVVDTIMKFWVSQKFEEFLTDWGTSSFSRRTQLIGASELVWLIGWLAGLLVS